MISFVSDVRDTPTSSDKYPIAFNSLQISFTTKSRGRTPVFTISAAIIPETYPKTVTSADIRVNCKPLYVCPIAFPDNNSPSISLGTIQR